MGFIHRKAPLGFGFLGLESPSGIWGFRAGRLLIPKPSGIPTDSSPTLLPGNPRDSMMENLCYSQGRELGEDFWDFGIHLLLLLQLLLLGLRELRDSHQTHGFALLVSQTLQVLNCRKKQGKTFGKIWEIGKISERELKGIKGWEKKKKKKKGILL